jgi:uncharacterized protein
MDRVFADTGYWIALLDPRDELHLRAKSVSQDLSRTRIVTSELVLVEFLNCFSDFGPQLRQAAAKAVNSLRASAQVTVVSQTASLFERALGLYQDMADKSWSFTDCTSISIMRVEGITAALTHDRHFLQAGFQALLR